jgi:Domain of unknown function (DUF4259)
MSSGIASMSLGVPNNALQATRETRAPERRRWATNIKTVLAIFGVLLVSSLSHAGAWGEGSFENDDALDWVAECVSSRGTSPIAESLNIVLGSDYVEAPDGAAALAAVEVVAAALGKPSAKLPPELRDWISKQSASELVRLAPDAQKVVDRISDVEVSELAQLWAEAEESNWQAAVAELSARLRK